MVTRNLVPLQIAAVALTLLAIAFVRSVYDVTRNDSPDE